MRIKQVIKEKGLSVKEVADRLGISSPALSGTINGNPTVEMLSRIAKAIGYRETEFFDRHETDIIHCPYCGGKIKVSKE